MGKIARSLLDTLDDEQRPATVTDFDSPDHRKWTYLPGPRPGLRLGDARPEQVDLALELLDSGCGALGAARARGVIALERILDELIGYDSGGDPYWVRILGDPSQPRWAWRVNGHHLAIHVTVVGDEFTVTPNFLGAQPAVVPRGPDTGLRTLPDEEDLARAIVTGLDERQREEAIMAKRPPGDILTRHDPVADPSRLVGGLGWEALAGDQQEGVRSLIDLYLNRAPHVVAERSRERMVAGGLDRVVFRWSGSLRVGDPHYYSVHGPTFVIEYDNTQDGGNHIHSVWRDLEGDWGEDLLADHYGQEHR
ncbi:MAG: DUF3500 domain-containing protein [Acidimicrobiia bacterium]|nr:DUF3500 domain-containing protein [Acidimicrobiia bacterium]